MATLPYAGYEVQAGRPFWGGRIAASFRGRTRSRRINRLVRLAVQIAQRVDVGAQAITAVEGGRGNASRIHEHIRLIDDADRLVAVHFRRPSYRRMRVQAVIGHSNEPSPRRHTGADRRVTGACHVAVQHAAGIVCLHDRPGFPFPWPPESTHA
jgi:hypothetical protein